MRTPSAKEFRKQRARKKVVAARPAVSRGRAITLLVLLAGVALGFGWRMVDLQLMPDEALAGDIGSQVRTLTIAAPRGEILDRHGRPIAFSLPRPSVVANPRLLQSADEKDAERDLLEEAVAQLSTVLSTDPAMIRDRLSREKAFVNLERQVDPEVGLAVLDLGIAGVYLDSEQRREHPHGSCSAIGVVGRVDIDQNGISGLEYEYDDHLQGTTGREIRQSQAGGQVRIPGGSQIIEPMIPGDDLVLTIDRSIQLKAEMLLIEALQEVEGDTGIVIVTNPNTGEVLAMANVRRNSETGLVDCTTNNLGATWVYEPGSIMKTLTFAGVFENDTMSETATFDIPHNLSYNLGAGVEPHVYRDKSVPVEGEAHTPGWVLRKSSNNGTILMARSLGADGLYNTMRDFGLGEVSSLDLPGEASGILDSLDSHALELSNASIGQSVAVTPLQMILAYNAIAAGGLQMEPILVSDQVGQNAPTRVVSESTADTLMAMLSGVVADGTGRRAAIGGYGVSGKTGTAWQPCGNGYWCPDGTRHLTASFAGILSNDSGPALSAIVVVDNPEGDRTGGGDVTAPIFSELMAYAAQQLRISPMTNGVLPDGRVRADPAVPVTAPVGEGLGQEDS
jgi:cell division protein FtsI/penicillin-binding protein 2